MLQGAMIVEEPVDVKEVQEEEREDHDFLCEERGYQDDTYFSVALCAL